MTKKFDLTGWKYRFDFGGANVYEKDGRMAIVEPKTERLIVDWDKDPKNVYTEQELNSRFPHLFQD